MDICLNYKNKYLNRILELSLENKIVWKKSRSIDKKCIRYIGIGIGHKFVLKFYNCNNFYVGYINKYITNIETTWEFIIDNYQEMYYFIFDLLLLIIEKET